MCKHQIVAKSRKGIIIWCHSCQVYTIRFKDIIIYLPPYSFGQFKESLYICYEDNIYTEKDRAEEFLIFRTSGSCMEFTLSINEVGDLLNLLQMSDFQLFAYDQLSLTG